MAPVLLAYHHSTQTGIFQYGVTRGKPGITQGTRQAQRRGRHPTQPERGVKKGFPEQINSRWISRAWRRSPRQYSWQREQRVKNLSGMRKQGMPGARGSSE